MSSITLEAELQRRAKGDNEADILWNRYKSVKGYLGTEYYRWIQANCRFFTDHGEQHIESVIQAASMLLNRHLGGRRREQSLSPLDVFLILSGILWHDVGNVYGRSNHAARVTEMTEKIKDLGFPNPDIRRIVDEIALAHGGKDGLTKARQEEDCAAYNSTYTVHPRELAAIVRFADEISENRSRISLALLPDVPNENRIFWEYANCISASRPEPERERVVITISMEEENAAKRFLCPEFLHRVDKTSGTLSLIEYVLCRLEKMNNERAYCARWFSRYARINEIEARFTLLKNTKRVKQLTVLFGDSGVRSETNDGYPDIRIFDDFFSTNPEWKPEEIQEELSK